MLIVGRLKYLGCVTLLLILTDPSVLSARQTATDSTKPISQSLLIKRAELAQQDKDFATAGGLWQQVWQKFPDGPYVGLSRWQAGYCLQQQQDFSTAIDNLKIAIPLLTDRRDQSQARLLLGYSQLELGKRTAADARLGDRDLANELFATATQTFQRLLKNDSKFNNADRVYFLLGDAFEQIGQADQAIQAYQKILPQQDPPSLYRFDALYAIGDLNHQQGLYGAALDSFDQLLQETKQAGHPRRDTVQFASARSMIELAAAARRIEDEPKAIKFYQTAIERLNKIRVPGSNDSDAQSDSLAALVGYHLAFIKLQLGQMADAVKTANSFLQVYPDHELVPDALQVKADALIGQQEFSQAESVLTRLTSNAAWEKHPQRHRWLLANANAKYQQQNFDGVIRVLRPNIGGFQSPGRRADALHVLGASLYRQGQYAQAQKRLSAALQVDPGSTLAEDSQYYLALAYLKQENFQPAVQTTTDLSRQTPASTRLPALYLRLGENRYQADQYAAAIELFGRVLQDSDARADLKAAASHGAGWANLDSRRWAAAERLFANVITKYPESTLVPTAKIGWQTARKEQGRDVAISTLILDQQKQQVQQADDSQKVALAVSVGKSLTADDQWQQAIEIYESVLSQVPDDPAIDTLLYELAWGHRQLKQEPQAIEYFKKIADQHAGSQFATEANYHLGKHAYDAGQYAAAQVAFQACASNPTGAAKVREKAAYKLAWALYKQDKFRPAHDAFLAQTRQFPDGPLLADGAFMRAESLFRDKAFADAIAAYQVARPIVDAAEGIDPELKWLLRLHAAQAANQLQQYSRAVELAKDIQDWELEVSDVDDRVNSAIADTRHAIWLELGLAHDGLQDSTQAQKFWEMATGSSTHTGARAMCLLGNQLYDDRKYQSAIEFYKRVFYGFGGRQSEKSVQRWQAFARLQAAQCNVAQLNAAADAGRKARFRQQAIEHCEGLVRDYPDDKLAKKANQQIQQLKRVGNDDG